MSKIRLSSHTLRIETDRYCQNRIDRHLRKCNICNTAEIEDEYHFILVCKQYSDIIIKYIKKYYYNNPSMFKLSKLLDSKNIKLMLLYEGSLLTEKIIL